MEPSAAGLVLPLLVLPQLLVPRGQLTLATLRAGSKGWWRRAQGTLVARSSCDSGTGGKSGGVGWW